MEMNFPEMFQIVDFILKMGFFIHSISLFCHEMAEPQT
jgi:hypothetical protein